LIIRRLCEYVYSQLGGPRSYLDPIRAIKAQRVEQRYSSTYSQPRGKMDVTGHHPPVP